jgi:hypothetical protein
MPQRFGLYEDLSVQENLGCTPICRRSARGARGALRRADAHDRPRPFLARLAGKLSGGMKQKLGLACTLVKPPELLLLDEPTVGVDPVSRRELWQIVDRLVERAPASRCVVARPTWTRPSAAPRSSCSRGRVLDAGPPDELACGDWRAGSSSSNPRPGRAAAQAAGEGDREAAGRARRDVPARGACGSCWPRARRCRMAAAPPSPRGVRLRPAPGSRTASWRASRGATS